MSRWKIILSCAAALIVVVAAALYLRNASIPILEPAGPVGQAELSVIVIVVALCAIVVVPVFVLLFYFAWKYRDGSPEAHVHHRPDWDHDSRAAEFAWWLVPTIIIGFLSVIAWDGAHALDPWKPLQGGAGQPIAIQVVSLDWKWLFIYPAQGIASVNLVEFPEDTPIHFYLTSDAPMNSFWIPQLGGQIMTMPGMTTQLNLMASRVGSFNGFSANISGDGFAGMAFTAKAVPESEFDAWVASTQASSTPLSQDSYSSLAAPSEYNPVVTYAPVDPNLFESIVMKYMMPAGASSGMQGMDMGGMDMGDMPMNMPMNTSTGTSTP